MKKLFLAFAVISFSLNSYAQCIPDDSCIDVGASGEICPDTLPGGSVNAEYSQTITIIPPDSFVYQGSPIYFSHIQVLAINNLPPGLSWETNAPDDLFSVGQKYCAQISGTPSSTGSFDLEINIYPYVGGFPLGFVIVDDTSLTITVEPEIISIQSLSYNSNSAHIYQKEDQICLNYSSLSADEVTFQIFDLTGRLIDSKSYQITQGDNELILNKSLISNQIYLFKLQGSKTALTGKWFAK